MATGMRPVSEALVLVLSLLGGVVTGLFYFGGLWLTLQQLPTARRPGLLILISFVGRAAVTLLIFIFLMGGAWPRLLAALAGFLLARLALVRYVGGDGRKVKEKTSNGH
jgi:F1F0 ATPase subunit 2